MLHSFFCKAHLCCCATRWVALSHWSLSVCLGPEGLGRSFMFLGSQIQASKPKMTWFQAFSVRMPCNVSCTCVLTDCARQSLVRSLLSGVVLVSSPTAEHPLLLEAGGPSIFRLETVRGKPGSDGFEF